MTLLSRTHLLKIRLTDDEFHMFNRVANEHGLDRPSLLRMLVAGERRRLFPITPKVDDAEAQRPSRTAGTSAPRRR
jgi:hypothetical protein